MKESGFEDYKNPLEGEEIELVPEANAMETALILAQKLLGYGQPGIAPEDEARRELYLKEAEGLLASAELKDAEIRKILEEGVRHVKEA